MRFSHLCSVKTVLLLLNVLLQMFLAMAMNCWTCKDFKELQEYRQKSKQNSKAASKTKHKTQQPRTPLLQKPQSSSFLLCFFLRYIEFKFQELGIKTGLCCWLDSIRHRPLIFLNEQSKTCQSQREEPEELQTNCMGQYFDSPVFVCPPATIRGIFHLNQ